MSVVRLLQAIFHCETCNFSEATNRGVCGPCAATCHVGHKLSAPQYETFYCDCGAEHKCEELARARGLSGK